MEGKSSFVILLVIVAVLTLTIALLLGYLFFVSDNSSKQAEVATVEKVVVPEETELSKKAIFEDAKTFNLRSDGASKESFINVGVELVYCKKVKGIKNIEERLIYCDGEIKEAINTYFQNMSLEEAKLPDTKIKAKNDLKKRLNEILSEGLKDIPTKAKENIVYKINFYEWLYQ